MINVLIVSENISRATGGIVTVVKMILDLPLMVDKVQFIKIFPFLPNAKRYQKALCLFCSIILFVLKMPFCHIVHIHHASNLNFLSMSIFVLLSKMFRKKVILHNHGADFKQFYEESLSVVQSWIHYIFKLADLVIVLSKSWYLWHSSIFVGSDIRILPNAAPFLADPNVLNIDNNECLNFLYLSRLEERKGITDLLRVIPDVLNAAPNARFILAGDGDIDYVKSFIDELGLSNVVNVPGYISGTDKIKLLLSADIFVLPSYDEGLPMALLETMSYGIVPVASSVGGIPDVIEDGENGFLVAPGQKDELIEKMLLLAENYPLRKYMAGRAYQTIKDSFSSDKYGESLMTIYNELVG